MKQKGMAIVMAVLLAAGTAAPVYAEEIYSFEAVYAGGSQQSSPPASQKPAQQKEESSQPSQKTVQQREESSQLSQKTVQQREESSQQTQKQQKEEVQQPKKIRVVKKVKPAQAQDSVKIVVDNTPVIVQISPQGQNVSKNTESPKPTAVQTSQEKPEQSGSDFPYTLESFAEEVLRLTNQARAEAGAPPLELDPTLNEMAQARKDENKGKMTHIRPDGTTADTIFKEYDTSLKCTGEIIMSVSRSPQAVVDGFMASKSHRENMLNPNHKYVGIGVSWGETPAGTGIAVLELFAK